MNRAGFILTVILSVTPVWAVAQVTPAEPAETALQGMSGNTEVNRLGAAPAADWGADWASYSPPTGVDNQDQGTQDEFASSGPPAPAIPGDYFSNPDSGATGRPFLWDGSGHGGHPAHCATCGSSHDWRYCCLSNPGHCRQTGGHECWVCDACGHDVQGRPGCGPNVAFRLGGWGVQSSGSPVKVGEYQSLSSSPFWDLDGLWTNGSQTLNYTFSGLDNETSVAQGYYYGGPGLAVDLDYQRFLHRLDHLPLYGFDASTGTPGPADDVVTEDLNVGEDYAIRVQQLDARFQGRLTKNLRWRVDVWGMRKSGERQANATAHCFNVTPPPGAATYTCHVLSQKQNIDWTTMEFRPALEANLGRAVVEYSRTMRVFGQNDQLVDRTYTAFNYSPVFGTPGPEFDYALVPESYTQIDRLKLNVPLGAVNQVYASMYFGDTENKFRGTHRDFDGYDVRWINRAIDNVTLTAYANADTQTNQLPTTFLTTPPLGINTGPPQDYEPGSLRHPIDYVSQRFGLKGNWQSPARNWLSVVAGYEYFGLERDFAEYDTFAGTYIQEDTQTHLINIGPYMRVSPTLDTFVRYRGRLINNPLIGVGSGDGKFNSNRPEQVHGIDIGGTWTPSPNLMATAQLGIENSWNRTQYAFFDEDNYPVLFTLWYAPTARWSLTGGYAFFSNWIDQDITIGFRDNPTETTRWNYGGTNNLVSLSTNYAWSPGTQLVGGVEWDRGSNVFSVPLSPAGADWSALPSFSDVLVETTRIHLGVDHEFRPSMNAYLRYVHFDFEDFSEDYNSGTANMILAGLTMLR